MRYGHFDDAAKEYVIETPATPLPWINYLGNEDFFSLISNTGGGYSFYKDAKLRRITRYRYNNVPADNGSRCYYLSLMDSDSADAKPVETWSPTFLPCKTPLDSYKCRQGIGYTVFEASKRGIESKLTAFVPLHTNAEINRLDVTNTTDEPAVIDVTGSVEWCLWNAVDDSSNFQRNLSTGEVEIERETDATLLYHKTEFKERRNHYAFYGVNAPVVGFDTSRDEFLGQFNGWDTPQVIAEGKAHDSVAHGWFPIAANRVRLELQPGETASLVFMLGYIEVAKDQKWEDPNDPAKVGIINKKPAHELFRRFATVEQVEAALKELNSYWSPPTASIPATKSSTVWSTSGTSTSAWSRSICPVPPPTTSRAWDAAWASAIPTRTCLASCISFRNAHASASSTSPPPKWRTVPHGTSTSRSPRRAMRTSVAASMMIRCGSWPACTRISPKPAT